MTPALSRDLAELGRALEGRLILDGHPDYDDARRVFYAGHDARPLAVARVAGTSDVVHVISLCRARGLEVAVRSGGHSLAGHSTTEGGIVIDLRDLRDVDVNASGLSAWAGAGLTAGEYTAATGTHGLATGFGDVSSVGLGGVTLGGGLGFLSRCHGLAIDQLMAAEVVTADGRVILACPRHREDLFWAVRGGGGNFGVVTRLRFRLQEVRIVFSGTLVLPATPAVVSAFVAAADAAPHELTAIATIGKAPSLPGVAAGHGEPVLHVHITVAADRHEAPRALAPFRALARPLHDDIGPVPFPSLFQPADKFHPMNVDHTMFIDRVDRADAAVMIEHVRRSTAAVAAVQLRVLGGAIDRVPVDATAYAHRGKRILMNIGSVHEGGAYRHRHGEWAARVAAELYQGDDHVYANFLGDEGADRVRNAYPGDTWRRLVELKRRYDPTNFFHRNHNIPPDG
jgi:FAD/FMN-containing dehydrogenase